MHQNMPFDRGETASGGNYVGLTLDSSWMLALAGFRVVVPDTVHGTGRKVTLVAVKNGAANLTIARKFVAFSTATALDYGRVISGYNTAAGGVVLSPDDAYTVGQVIPAYDVFYCVLAGPVTLTTEASSVSLAAGDQVASDASAFVNGAAAAAGEYVYGVIDAASTTTGASVVIHATGNLALPPAAG